MQVLLEITYRGVEKTDALDALVHEKVAKLFDRLEIGTGVRFFLKQGEQGSQASTVQIVNKLGSRVGKSGEEEIEPPLGWK